jgi:hypothetical protein
MRIAAEQLLNPLSLDSNNPPAQGGGFHIARNPHSTSAVEATAG